jgi:hypothetical protein
MDYQVVLTASSRRDLQDIIRYISFDDPARALPFGRFLIITPRIYANSQKRAEWFLNSKMNRFGK